MFRICLYTGIILAVSALSIADTLMVPDSCDNPMDASIYYVIREPDRGHLRVTLYEYWGMYGMYVEENRFDDIEGLPSIISSYQFTCEDLEHALSIDYIWGLEFIGWIDSVTFKIGFNHDQFFTIQRVGKGEFLLRAVQACSHMVPLPVSPCASSCWLSFHPARGTAPRSV